MNRFLLAYAGALAAYCILDFIWLGVVAKGFYQSQVGELMAARPVWPAAILLYALYPLGIVYFAAAPAMSEGALGTALLRGALLGLVVYGTYDLTNLAVLRGWTVTASVVDALWGGVVTAAAAAAGFALARLAGAAP